MAVINISADVEHVVEYHEPVTLTPASSNCRRKWTSTDYAVCLCSFIIVLVFVGSISFSMAFILPAMFSQENLFPEGNQRPELRIQSAALYPLNSSTSDELNGTWNLTLLAINPNKKLGIHYQTLQASLFYSSSYTHHQDLLVASKSSRPLFVPARNQTRISIQLPMVSEYVGDDIAREISDGNSTALWLKFRLRLSVGYKFGYNEVKKFRKFHRVDYHCNRVQVQVFPPGYDVSNVNVNRTIMVTAQSTKCKLIDE